MSRQRYVTLAIGPDEAQRFRRRVLSLSVDLDRKITQSNMLTALLTLAEQHEAEFRSLLAAPDSTDPTTTEG